MLGLLETIKESDGELNEGLKAALDELDPFQLERAEDELMEEGVTRDDLILLCDARVKAFTEAEVIEEAILERPEHPIHTLMEEHRQILLFMTEVRGRAMELRTGKRSREETMCLQEVGPFLTEAQKHFQREENVLFPYLERHGIEGPPAAMWSEHEVLRANEKELNSLIARERYMDREEFLETLECRTTTLLALLNAHFHKENHVTLPDVHPSLGRPRVERRSATVPGDWSLHLRTATSSSGSLRPSEPYRSVGPSRISSYRPGGSPSMSWKWS